VQSTVNSATDMTTTIELTNYVKHLESELMGLNQSFVEMQLRQRNMEAEAATNEQRKFDELTNIVNNQSIFLVTLQDNYASLERDNRLLVERILNQSLMINEMMIGREQKRQTLLPTEMKQRDDKSWKSVTVSHDQRSPLNYAVMFPDPPIYKTHEDGTPKGRLYFLNCKLLGYSSLRVRCTLIFSS